MWIGHAGAGVCPSSCCPPAFVSPRGVSCPLKASCLGMVDESDRSTRIGRLGSVDSDRSTRIGRLGSIDSDRSTRIGRLGSVDTDRSTRIGRLGSVALLPSVKCGRSAVCRVWLLVRPSSVGLCGSLPRPVPGPPFPAASALARWPQRRRAVGAAASVFRRQRSSWRPRATRMGLAPALLPP